MIRKFINKVMPFWAVITLIGVIQFDVFNNSFFIYVAIILGVPMTLAMLIDVADRLGRFKKFEDD